MPLNSINMRSNATLRDVLTYLHSSSLSPLTIVDYEAQIMRCISLYEVNRIEDIPADLTAFLTRWPKKRYPAKDFKSVSAYLAFRKKMISILKGYHGILDAQRERANRKDEWFQIIQKILECGVDLKYSLISIRTLADEARKNDLQPRDLDAGSLDKIYSSAHSSNRSYITKAIKALNKARESVLGISQFVPHKLSDPTKIMRYNLVVGPSSILMEKLLRAVSDYCRGDFDMILQEYSDSKSTTTEAVYISSVKKYYDAALRGGFLTDGCEDLNLLFSSDIFVNVIRFWIEESDPARKITPRTMDGYVRNIITICKFLKLPTSFMEKSRKSNRVLKQGNNDAKVMPRETREFCAVLLRNRSKELLFRSFHLRLKERALALNDEDHAPFREARIIQLGMLSAYAAIALWGVPLRIGNLHELRHRGENPTLLLPTGMRKDGYIHLPATDVKNRKPIRASIFDGPTRAIEVIEWYLDEIRPRIPNAAHSPYLFPGYRTDVMGKESLRYWVQKHSMEMGLPMGPHNFRHGLASLYLRDHPGEYSQAALLLCISPEVVRSNYAWIDEEREMEMVQREVARLGGFTYGA